MRVCSPSLGHAADTGSGGERYEALVLAGLAEKDDVHVPMPAKAWRRAAPRTGHLLPFWSPPMHWSYAAPFFVRAIARCWDRCGPFDVIRCHSPQWLGPASVFMGAVLGVPVVMHLHHLERRFGSTVERLALQHADRIIVDSEFVRGQALALGLPAERIHVVPCGVGPFGKFGYASAMRRGAFLSQHGIPNTARLIVALGPMVARKNPVDAMYVFRRVVEDVPNTYALWMGDGPLRRECQRLVEKMGVADKVKLPGFVPEADKRALLASADVFLHLSELEGWPLAVLEAMAAGVPVVARNAASLPEIVREGQDGYLRSGSLGESIGCCIYLLEQDSVRQHMAHHARLRAAEFPWSRTVEGVRAVLRGAVANHKR